MVTLTYSNVTRTRIVPRGFKKVGMATNDLIATMASISLSRSLSLALSFSLNIYLWIFLSKLSLRSFLSFKSAEREKHDSLKEMSG